MKQVFFIFIIMSIAIACNAGLEKPPINRQKMAKILVDVHIAESAMQDLQNAEKKDSIGRIYYSKIFKIHKVSGADFDQSLKYYRKDPAKMETLYKEVIAELEKQDNEAHK